MSAKYLQSIQEVRQWLSYKKLHEFIFVLLDNGYDDLDAISQASDGEMSELVDLFPSSESKANARIIVETLRDVGITSYRSDAGLKEFKRLIAKGTTPATALKPTDSKLTVVPQVVRPSPSARSLARVKSDSVTGGKEGYLSLRVGGTGNKWADKYCVLQDAKLKYLTSRKEGELDEVFPLSKVIKIEKGDKHTIKLLLSSHKVVELWTENEEDLESWMFSLTEEWNTAKTGEVAPQQAKPKAAPKDKAAAAEDDGEDASGDPKDEKKEETWEALISENADERVRATMGSALPSAVDLISKKRGTSNPTQVDAMHEKRLKKYLGMLVEGAMFKKYKRGSSARRLVWTTPFYDFVCWGDDTKDNIKGYIATRELTEINQGFGKNRNRFYIVSSTRTLELEAKTPGMAKEWVIAFQFLIQSHVAEDERKQEIANTPGFRDAVNKSKTEHTALLVAGDVFKKWPGRKKMQKGSFTVRKIWANPQLDKLNWGDIQGGSKSKEKGFLILDDMVQVQEDPKDELKFTVYAKGRSLDLEAKSQWVREKWVRALRFFIEFKSFK